MDALYTGILTVLDSLIPTAQLTTWGSFNEFLAYILTIIIIWSVLLRPLLKLARVVK